MKTVLTDFKSLKEDRLAGKALNDAGAEPDPESESTVCKVAHSSSTRNVWLPKNMQPRVQIRPT